MTEPTESTEPSVDELLSALRRHASPAGDVFPSARRLIAAEEHWSGRLWDVLALVMADLECMRYLAGGSQPEEIVQCAVRWAESPLSLEEIKAIFGCGGYDPDPFVVLAGAGLLLSVTGADGATCRHVEGERAGAWISDQLALASPEEVVERTRALLDKDRPRAVP